MNSVAGPPAFPGIQNKNGSTEVLSQPATPERGKAAMLFGLLIAIATCTASALLLVANVRQNDLGMGQQTDRLVGRMLNSDPHPMLARWEKPEMALGRALDCLLMAASPADCRNKFEAALNTDRRCSQALLSLAQIEEWSGNTSKARGLLEEALIHDHSFAPLWAYWSFLDRRGESTEELERRVVTAAPPTFRGHFPILWRRGWTPEKVLSTLNTQDSQEQAWSLISFLVETSDPRSTELILRLLHLDAQDATAQLRIQQATRAIVRHALDEPTTLDNAAELWREVVERTSRPDSNALAGGIPDRRVENNDDPFWNYNPRIQLPVAPASFDWSIAQNRYARTAQLTAGDGGIRVELLGQTPKELVLLARTIPRLRTVSQIRVETWIETDKGERSWEDLGNETRNRNKREVSSSDACLQWELRDLDGVRRWDSAIVIDRREQQQNRKPSMEWKTRQLEGFRSRQVTQSAVELRLPDNLDSTPSEKAIQLMLVLGSTEGCVASVRFIDIHQVRLNPM